MTMATPVRGDRHAAWELAWALSVVLNCVVDSLDPGEEYPSEQLRGVIDRVGANGKDTADVIAAILADERNADEQDIRKNTWWIVFPTELTTWVYAHMSRSQRQCVNDHMMYCIKMALAWEASLPSMRRSAEKERRKRMEAARRESELKAEWRREQAHFQRLAIQDRLRRGTDAREEKKVDV